MTRRWKPLPPPSAEEREAIIAATARNRQREKPLAMVARSKEDGSLDLNPPHNDEAGWAERILDTFATDSVAAAHVEHLTRLSMGNHPAQPSSADAGLAFVTALKPQNAMESALAVQMFGAHVNSIEMMVRANKAATVDHALAYSNIANKFSRTFATQMEALAKLRRGGEQVIRHVHVDNRGGQAIIADTVNTGVVRMETMADNPTHKPPMLLSPRCGARTRSGMACRSPAMPNGRCRMHGGSSPGAPKGNRNAWKHGRDSGAARAERKALHRLIAEMKRSVATIV